MKKTLQFSVGYNQSIKSNRRPTLTIVESFNNVGDNLTDLTTRRENFAKGTGVNLNVDYVKQRNSGWRTIYGLSLFVQKASDVLILTSTDPQPTLINLRDIIEQSGYLTSRLGVGYLWYNPKKVSWFVNGFALIGSSWKKYLTTSYHWRGGTSDDYDMRYKMKKSNLLNGLLFGYGLQFEFGGYVPINKKWMLVATLQSSIYFSSSWSYYIEQGAYENEKMYPEINNKDNPEYFPVYYGFGSTFNNIGLSIGVNYKL